MVTPVRSGAPLAAPAQRPLSADTASALAGLPAHSPLVGLRQDPLVTVPVTRPGPHAAACAALIHHGHTLEGLQPLSRPSDPA